MWMASERCSRTIRACMRRWGSIWRTKAIWCRRCGSRWARSRLLLLAPCLFVPRLDLEPDWCAFETEGLADLVFQEPFEGEVQLDIAVGEENEGGRGYGSLRHVEN